jgi:3-hydroxyacyl-CoA dehydrogenase
MAGGSSDGVAVIVLDNPPVNGLRHSVRTRIVEEIDAAVANDAVRAIVITGANGLFSGGADIREFNTPAASAEPTLHTVIRVVESCAKPVISAIEGHCMGGGLELSLACHYRVARPNAQVGLPEVKFGIVPGAGGTQRLPRAAGVENALNMVVSGNAVAAAKLEDTGLFDGIVEGDLREGAIAFARRVADARPLPRVRDRPAEHPDAEAFFAFAKANVAAAARNFPAPAKCVEAVAAAVSKPFDEGLKIERSLFLQLVQSPESRALRHAFFAERAASKIADVAPDTPIRPIKSVAVIGAGTMGGGIAMNFLDAGIPVTILEANAEALERGVATIRRNYESGVKRGKLIAQDVEKRMALLWPTLLYDDVKDADLVIEAVFESMEVKDRVFRQLDLVAKQGAILATNTSTLDVDRIAAFTFRPQDVVGLHFFSPANVMKLLEVVRGAKTAKDVLATAMQLAKRIRKTAVVSGVCDGFIGNRMVEHYLRQALFLVEEGASPAEVDGALEKFGMAMGPFRMSDLAGLDIGWAIRKRRYVERPDVPYSRVADRLCEQGRFGQKTGAGWYRYAPGKRDALPDPEVDRIIEAYRAERGVKPRRIGEDEIVGRCVYALVNEGARILEEGIAARASDIDLVYLAGYGFPAWRGGPMLYADMTGLYNVMRAMKGFAANPADDPAFWRPAPLLAKLAAEGKTFT